jgi:hypothetical protein
MIYPSNQLCSSLASDCETVVVNPPAQVNDPSDQVLCNGSMTTPVVFWTVNTVGTTAFTWENDTPGIGLAATGSGNIPSFTAVNNGSMPVVATITVYPHLTGGPVTCDGPSQTFLIKVNPKPVLVTTPQSACSPSRVNLTLPAVTAGSTLFGALLSYWTNAAATIPLTNPTSVGTGTYYIKATTSQGCFDIKPVTVTINPLPTLYSGVGSGSYCEGGPGLAVGISGSQIGVNYTMYIGLTPVFSTVAGTGGPISFGYQTQEGTYWVLAQRVTTGCMNRMDNCVHITINHKMPVSATISASSNPVNTGDGVTFTAYPVNGGTNPVYQWVVNGVNAGTGLNAFSYIPLNGDDVKCVLTSSLSCTSNNPASSNTVIMEVSGIPGTSTVTGIVAEGQTKCYNAEQTLIVAGGGSAFVVQNGANVTMIAGQNIVYQPGTKVLPGGYMRGYISNQYCNEGVHLPSTITGGESVPAITEKASFRIYPNPAGGKFTLEQKGAALNQDVRVEIYTMQGEKVMARELIQEKKTEFSIEEFTPGLYFVKVIAGEFVETIKLIKTH